MRALKLLALLSVIALLLSACGRNMWDQPRADTYRASDFFADNSSARPLVAGTIPRGFDRTDEHFYFGTVGGAPAEGFPYLINIRVVERGREQYSIFCQQCHGALGDGNGIVVQRGFPQPQSFHSDRLRQMPEGYFYNVITNGFGRMYPYNDRIQPEDRWAIVAYMRALQISQVTNIQDLPPSERERLERMPQ